jgi:hypothetical protein
MADSLALSTVDRQLNSEFGRLDQVPCREQDSVATLDHPMCGEPDEHGLSVTLAAQRLIANRQKLRFDAQCLIVRRMIRTGDRPLRGVHHASRDRGKWPARSVVAPREVAAAGDRS